MKLQFTPQNLSTTRPNCNCASNINMPRYQYNNTTTNNRLSCNRSIVITLNLRRKAESTWNRRTPRKGISNNNKTSNINTTNTTIIVIYTTTTSLMPLPLPYYAFNYRLKVVRYFFYIVVVVAHILLHVAIKHTCRSSLSIDFDLHAARRWCCTCR